MKIVSKKPDPIPERRRVFPIRVRGRYDVAQTNDDNRRHWLNVDYLSANASANPAVRRVIRARGRYEIGNNSYASGIVRTYSNDVIGTRPALQVPIEDKEKRRFAQDKFKRWMKAAKIVPKLRTMIRSLLTDGEAFAILVTNPLIKGPVKLDLKLVEADRVTTPDFSHFGDPNAVDGIVFDEYGNPKTYHILKQHPGSDKAPLVGRSLYDEVPAAFVMHLFNTDRPEQSRGITPLTPSLPIFAETRQYRGAVLSAARTAANISLFMKTDLPPDQQAAEVDPMATMEVEENMATFVPEGWEPFQIKAEQPTTIVSDFSRDVIAEAARPIHMPKNVALCDSSSYNYASGRMDHQVYFKGVDVQRIQVEEDVLDVITDAYFTEAGMVYPELRGIVEAIEQVEPVWMWGGRDHVDPVKEASAVEKNLATFTTTLQEEGARQGKDWEARLRQCAKERDLLVELELIPDPKATPPSLPSKEDEEVEEEEEDEADKLSEGKEEEGGDGGNGHAKAVASLTRSEADILHRLGLDHILERARK